MSDQLRPCLNCDYPLPLDPPCCRCPECGEDNTDLEEVNAFVEETFARPWTSMATGRLLTKRFRRAAWRARAGLSAAGGRHCLFCALWGFVIPLLALALSAAVSVKTTVRCESRIVPDDRFVVTYERPDFLEYHWFDWRGWTCHSDQSAEWCHLALHPVVERIDRAVIDRTLDSSRWLESPHYLREEAKLAIYTVLAWWGVAGAWLCTIWYLSKREQANGGCLNQSMMNIVASAAMSVAASGGTVALVLLVDFLIRLTATRYGAGSGTQWYATRSFVPWSLLLPVLLLWWFSLKSPPYIGRWARWPLFVIGAAGMFLLRLLRLTGVNLPADLARTGTAIARTWSGKRRPDPSVLSN